MELVPPVSKVRRHGPDVLEVDVNSPRVDWTDVYEVRHEVDNNWAPFLQIDEAEIDAALMQLRKLDDYEDFDLLVRIAVQLVTVEGKPEGMRIVVSGTDEWVEVETDLPDQLPLSVPVRGIFVQQKPKPEPE